MALYVVASRAVLVLVLLSLTFQGCGDDKDAKKAVAEAEEGASSAEIQEDAINDLDDETANLETTASVESTSYLEQVEKDTKSQRLQMLAITDEQFENQTNAYLEKISAALKNIGRMCTKLVKAAASEKKVRKQGVPKTTRDCNSTISTDVDSMRAAIHDQLNKISGETNSVNRTELATQIVILVRDTVDLTVRTGLFVVDEERALVSVNITVSVNQKKESKRIVKEGEKCTNSASCANKLGCRRPRGAGAQRERICTARRTVRCPSFMEDNTTSELCKKSQRIKKCCTVKAYDACVVGFNDDLCLCGVVSDGSPKFPCPPSRQCVNQDQGDLRCVIKNLRPTLFRRMNQILAGISNVAKCIYKLIHFVGDADADKKTCETGTDCAYARPLGVLSIFNKGTCDRKDKVDSGDVCKIGDKALDTKKECKKTDDKCLDKATPGAPCTAKLECTCQKGQSAAQCVQQLEGTVNDVGAAEAACAKGTNCVYTAPNDTFSSTNKGTCALNDARRIFRKTRDASSDLAQPETEYNAFHGAEKDENGMLIDSVMKRKRQTPSLALTALM